MPLSLSDFEPFDLEDAQHCLESFDLRTKRKGESYYRSSAVKSLACEEPGKHFSAPVQGSKLYAVSFVYDDEWNAECTCPVGYECKHVYAALRHLLAEYARLEAAGADAASGKSAPLETAPTGFAGVVQNKLARKLTAEESRYLKNLSLLFRKSQNGGLNYMNDLSGLGLAPNGGWWDRLELYPSPPRTEAEFWNYLALYLEEKSGRPIPEFMLPVTELTKVPARMRKHFRARDIVRWNHMLSALDAPAYQTPQVLAAAQPVELRVRLLPKQVAFEWRLSEAAPWTELKPRKANDFEARYAASLSAEAALLWLPFYQRVSVQFGTNFEYTDPWVTQQLGRWLRLPLLRPMLVDETGQPLVFHDVPLRWQVAQPDDTEGDYAFSLVQADGQPVPELRLSRAIPIFI